jgi:hypothetical protein
VTSSFGLAVVRPREAGEVEVRLHATSGDETAREFAPMRLRNSLDHNTGRRGPTADAPCTVR